jgi:soluble cytochrome b562
MVVMLVLSFSGVGYAQTLPHESLTPDPDLSAKALQAMKDEFSALKNQLLAALPDFEPDEQDMINELIAKIDAKLLQINTVDVYFSPDNFDDLFATYNQALGNCITIENDDVQMAVSEPLPPGISFPDETIESLNKLVEAGKVQAATCTSVKSRITVSTVYIDPDSKVVLEKNTIVVATDK